LSATGIDVECGVDWALKVFFLLSEHIIHSVDIGGKIEGI
jgi:hypothetical protein